jgi:Na+-translocating ferredoxin:NAD+ oxidoreductase subunit C
MGWFSPKSASSLWPREIPTFTRIPADQPPIVFGGGPNLARQLEHARKHSVDTIICSALDSDPRLRLNAAVAARFAAQISAGMNRLAELTGAGQQWIVVEEYAPPCWNRPIREAAGRIRVIDLPNHYPQADPTLLLYTLLGRRLPPGSPPSDQGAIIVDAPAAAAFGDGNMTSVPLGVLNHRTGKAFYLDVPAGMTLSAALDSGGLGAADMDLLGGDFLREHHLSPDHRVGEGDLTVHLLPRAKRPAAEPCIRCGWCAQVCPTRVAPAWVLEAAQRGDRNLAHAAGFDACIECGLCDQICPAHLPLVAAIRQVKGGFSNSTPS